MFAQQYSQETLHSQSHISVCTNIRVYDKYLHMQDWVYTIAVLDWWAGLMDWARPVGWTGLD